MNIRKIPVDVKTLLHNAMLVSIAPAYEYQNGNRTDKMSGYKYNVLLPNLGYEKVAVKVSGDKQLDVGDEAIGVVFDNAEAKLYCIDGRYDISITASSVKSSKSTAVKQ